MMETADRWVAEHAGDLSAWCAQIFDFAEPAWREYRSAAWYVARLRAEGFEDPVKSATPWSLSHPPRAME